MRDSSASFSTAARFGVLALVCLALSGCDPRPADTAFFDRGGPESLIDVSSEVVNLSVASPSDLAELSNWIDKDQQTSAELYCKSGDPRCVNAQKVLDLEAVPTKLVPSGDYSVALVYERILAHDCSARFVDNTVNHYNAHHPAFGCATAANIVQHVSDKQQLVSPNLMDMPSANGPVQAYGRIYAPKTTPLPVYGVDQSTVSKGKSSN